MRFLEINSDIKLLETGVKNKWRWEWIEERDTHGQIFGEWLKKIDVAGMAFCDVCGKTINYRSSGKKAFSVHAEDSNHKAKLRIIKSNQVLPGSSKAKPETESMQNRVAKHRAIAAAFISEHCLPFTLAEDLINLAKRLSQDKPALDKTTLSKSSATYINTHGVGKSFKDELKQKLKGQMLSLNIDEATNNNNDKILNVIVQYYDEEESQVALRHLGSRKQNLATAANIMGSLQSILQEYDIEWCQIISILMDNCSTMRGKRGGVEALVREENPNLLDVSGCTVHMINNVAKTLLSTVDEGVQSFCSDLFYDIEESPKVRQLFHELQTLMNATTPKHLVRPISSRFLQMLDVATRVIDLQDYLMVYYYSFLSEKEKTQYRMVVSRIFQDHKVSDEAQAAIILLQIAQEKQQKSATSNDRKERILNHLFQHKRETLIKLNLFRGLLSVFHGYVKEFQSEKPLIHTLHGRMYDVTTELLAFFIKPEFIPDHSVRKLKKLDLTDSHFHKSDKDMSVGKYAYADLNKARLDKTCSHWVTRLYSRLRTGYIKAAKKLLQLPLDNKTIRLQCQC